MRSIGEIQRAHRRVEAEPLAPNMAALLDGAVERYPDRKALVFFEQGVDLTYRELAEQVKRLASGLAAIGVRKGSHMAIMLPNVAAFPITWLALARLGAVMVPVNCRYKARELGYVLDDGDAEFLLIHNDFVGLLGEMETWPPKLSKDRVIVYGDGSAGMKLNWSELVASGTIEGAPPAMAGLDDLLNIQYTSGTTGFPKGCMQTHRYWVSAGHAMRFTDGSDVTRILAPTFYFYLDDMLMTSYALHVGATLYVANQLSASRFMQWVRQYDIEYVFLFEPVFKQPPHPDDGRNKLKLACILGFSKGNHAELEARFGAIARERFGMTEGGLLFYVPNDHEHMVGSGSCGIPAPFREAAIRDEQGRPVPTGEVGELWVRGPGVIEAYYKKPDANAHSFHDGWMRTGDVFRQDADGYFYIVGRIKDMIRRSQENISAHELEAVLRTMAGIREAACVPVPDEHRGEEVKAYVELEAGLTCADIPPHAIVSHCERNLAVFKIPRYLEYVLQFPYGPSQKVEKRRLIEAKPDLRLGSYDRIDGVWR